MSEAINKSDIIKGNPFKEIAKEIDDAYESLKKFDDTLKSAAKSAKDFDATQKQTLQDIEKINKAERESKKLIDEKINNERNLIKLETEKERLKQAEIRTQTQLRKESERLTKLNEKNAKAVKDEGDAYKRLSNETRKQKNEAKRLAAEMINLEKAGKRNSKEYRTLASTYRNLSRQALKGDQALKKIDRRLGDNFRNVGNYQSALRKLSSSLGSLGVVFGAGAILRGAGANIATFEQSIADLSAITGAGGEDLQFFKDQAIELGKTTEGGAAAVVEAYKLIGSAKPELLENAQALDAVTQSAITLSKASGLELPDAATRLTDAMNQFGASAEEADKFINVLAAGSKAGAAEIPQVTEALLKFGAVAKTSNVSIEESTGLVEALAEKGLKGAEAGTALRNVMLKLSAPDALPKKAIEAMNRLGISFDDISDPSKTFAERLEIMKPLLSDSAALQQVFGKENAVAALNVIENTDRIKELTKAVTDTNTANEQAATRSKTLGEAFKNIGRAWDSFVLSLVNGEDSTKGLRDFLDWIARNIPNIVSWVIKLAKAFGTYKAVLFALKMKDRIGDFVNFGSAIKDSATATDGATKSVKGLGGAITSLGLTALISLLVEVTTRFYDLASGASRARWQIEQFEKAKALANREAKKFLDNLKEEGDERKKAIQDEIERLRLEKAKNKVALAKAKIDRDAKKNNELLTFSIQEHAEQLAIAEAKTGLLAAKDTALRDTIIALKASLTDEAAPAIEEYNEGTTTATTKTQKFTGAVIEAGERVKELWSIFDKYDPWEEYSKNYEQGLELLNNLPEVENDPLAQMVTVTPEDIDFTTFEEIISEFDKFQIAITEILTDQIDKRIALMQKEQDAAKSQQSYLEQLAANGNVTAQQSIAEQIEIQREAQREQARLERQKQNIELISQGLSTFNSELQAGKTPGEALTSTILSTTALVGFLKNIQFFAKGTQYAPEGLAVVDEQGAEIITDSQGKIKQVGTDKGSRMTYLNKGDKVYTAKQTSEMLGAFDSVENANMMNRINGHAGNGYDIMILNKSLHEIKDAVKSAPRDNMNWDGLRRVIPEFTRTRTSGGDRFTERYKARRS